MAHFMHVSYYLTQMCTCSDSVNFGAHKVLWQENILIYYLFACNAFLTFVITFLFIFPPDAPPRPSLPETLVLPGPRPPVRLRHRVENRCKLLVWSLKSQDLLNHL